MPTDRDRRKPGVGAALFIGVAVALLAELAIAALLVFLLIVLIRL